jgi:CheY-like chemotaxis protein
VGSGTQGNCKILLIEVKAMHDVRGIALTGHGFPHHRQRCEAAGFEAFLLKPVTLKELLTVIHSTASKLSCHEVNASAIPQAIHL